ncbi:hypothetical protein GW17_00009753 [Ensete ventricosum]|nr:hypothetical protein GW17_00009753 [Ensete ventricosum]
MESPEGSPISLPDQQSLFPWDTTTEEREKTTNLAAPEPRRGRSPPRRPSLHSHGGAAAGRRFDGPDVSSSPAIPEDSPSTPYERLPEESHLVVRIAALHVGGNDGYSPARTLQSGHGYAGVSRWFGGLDTPLFLAPDAVQRTTALEAEPDWSGSLRNYEGDALSRLRLAPSPAPRSLEPSWSIPTRGVYASRYVGQNRLQRTGVGAGHVCSLELHRLSILSSSYIRLMTSGKCIYCMAKDKRECQKLLQLAGADDRQLVDLLYRGIIDHVDELMVHPYGNDLMLKLLEVCNNEQTCRITFKLTADPIRFVRISLNPHGYCSYHDLHFGFIVSLIMPFISQKLWFSGQRQYKV